MSGDTTDGKYGFGGQMTGGVNYGAGSPAGFGMSTGGNHGNGGASAPEPVKDISTAQFMSEVIEGSKSRPVIVDFWAPWCGPCKQLAPALESAVAKAGGKVRLVKMNIDEHPEVAGQMGIQSIPAVVAFVDGQPKDAFMGARPEGEISRFIEKLVGATGGPSPVESALEEADGLMKDNQFEQAAGLYGAILQQDPGNENAMAGYGTALLRLGQHEEAGMIADNGRESENPAMKALVSAIELHRQAAELGNRTELEERIAAKPDDHQARFDLALVLNALGEHEEAADQLLHIISKNRNWNEDAARTQLLKFFEAWGNSNPATGSGRRRLSSLLFS